MVCMGEWWNDSVCVEVLLLPQLQVTTGAGEVVLLRFGLVT